MCQPSVAFHVEKQSFDLHRKSNDWFLYERQRWAEMG